MIKLRGVEAGSEWALMVTRETAHLSGSEFIVDGQCERSARLALDSDVVLGSIVLRLQSVGCSTETQSITLPEGVFGAGGSVAVLTSASEGYPGGECRLVAGQELLIGQSADANLVLADDMVSPLHARMSAASDGIWLEDLGSTHGSFVNGEAVMGRIRLADGNRILIGNVVLRLRMGAERLDGQHPEALVDKQPRPLGPGHFLVDAGTQRSLADCRGTLEETCANCGKRVPVGAKRCIYCHAVVPVGVQPLLIFISGKYQGGEYQLESGTIVIGRDKDVDLVLVDGEVSRRHAEIQYRTYRIGILDLGSTNGTFVNGERISRCDLKDGDRVLIGTSIIKLVWKRPEQPPMFGRLPSRDGELGSVVGTDVPRLNINRERGRR
ncbi:MAG: FHA domain-containing protein [Myxococcota bacterium]|nr:FHA domain-containing protein [Myxococcota bacterium]